MDGDVIHSQEGTTQGEPLTMSMYVLATIPLIQKLKDDVNDVKQVWYADDASGSGKIESLPEWWDQRSTQGTKFGYFVNVDKT